MSTNQNTNSLGEQMKGALSEALETGDFNHLNNLVSATVRTALDEAKSAVEDSAREQNRQRVLRQQEEWQRRQNRQVQLAKEWENHQKVIQEQQKRFQERVALRQHQMVSISPQRPVQNRTMNSPVPMKRVGSVAGVLYKVFGGIGLGLSTIGICIVAPLAFAWTWIPLSAWALFYGMIQTGVKKSKRLQRVDRYIQICGQKMFSDVGELAAHTNQSIRYVRRDLKKMIRDGIFLQGHLDERGNTFMLNDVVYGNYLDAMKSCKEREMAEQKRLEPIQEVVVTPKEVDDTISAEEAELNAMVAEGMGCIQKLREMNDKIEGEVISEKLYKLEGILNEIFNRVKAHPEQRNRMHKMMDYYLPTTLKLVEAYEEFDRVSVPGEEILSAKAEIEKTLDTINEAFVELLNNLFQNTAFDVTTDAQVLQTMLAKEGLTKGIDFSEKSEMEEV